MDCQALPEISYHLFSQKLHQQGLKQRFPVAATLELTERCNLNCVHCYINRPVHDREAQGRELTTGQWLAILDDMAAAGTLWVLFTGGEPLLRPDFRELYVHAKSLGMIVTVFTNGTLITPALADFFREWPPFIVEVSVYGHTSATCEAVTRSPGSQARCLRGIELLRDRGLPVRLKTMAMTLNAHEVRELKAWAQSLGVAFRYDALLNLRLDGGRQPVNLRLTPEEVVRLDSQDDELTELFQGLWADSYELPEDAGLFFCGAGLDSYHVDASGHLHLCMMVRKYPYDLVRGSFQAGWQQLLQLLQQQRPREDYPCNRCALLNLCAQCPGWGLVEEGDPGQPVPYLCQVAHLRAQALGINPPGPECRAPSRPHRHTKLEVDNVR
jgi:radical SAM protein with 4Fe4S-binding SPASM domain